MQKHKILSSAISIGSYQDFLNAIFSLTDTGESAYVVFANVHMLMEAHRDLYFNNIVNEANLAAPDGKPLSIFLKLADHITQERICGMDVLPDLIRQAERLGKSVYFYGNTVEVLENILNRINSEHPSLNVAGYYSPPFRELSAPEKKTIIENINKAQPDLLLVSLGCPKQEKWMAEHRGKIKSCMLGLGQAFNTYAGKENRPPRWMRRFALEWTYRLYLEPRRLWKRYLYTNTAFIFLIIRNLLLKLFTIEHLAFFSRSDSSKR